MRRIIDVWDDNREGTISLLEFAEIVRDLQVFEQFDLDRSGFISAAELRSALGKLGVQISHPETSALLAKYDDDQSGMIEFPEFRRLAEDLRRLSVATRAPSLKCTALTRRTSALHDVKDNMMNADLDTTFKKKSEQTFKNKNKGAGAQPTSVLGGARIVPTSVLGGAQASSVLAPYAGGSNPFEIRGARLQNSVKPKLHESRSMIRD